MYSLRCRRIGSRGNFRVSIRRRNTSFHHVSFRCSHGYHLQTLPCPRYRLFKRQRQHVPIFKQPSTRLALWIVVKKKNQNIAIMPRRKQSNRKKRNQRGGRGGIDLLRTFQKLNPPEMYWPGYQYMSPFTKLKKDLSTGILASIDWIELPNNTTLTMHEPKPRKTNGKRIKRWSRPLKIYRARRPRQIALLKTFSKQSNV